MTEPEADERGAPEENRPGTEGWCAWGGHAGVIHSNNGVSVCVKCFNEAETRDACRHCGFEGITGQLLEVSSGAPICHECHDKAAELDRRSAIEAVWGIHVIGVARRRACPQAVRRRPRLLQRVPTHLRRRWRGSPRSTAGDEVLVARRFRGRRRVHPPESPSRQRTTVRDRPRRTGLRLSGYPRRPLSRLC